MEDYSLLAYIAPRLTIQLENLATDSLFYLLKRYELLGNEFIKVIADMGLIIENALTFDTQIAMSGGEIPDLVGTNEEGDTILLVESKFWAPLSPNQPISYLSRLSSNCDGMVVILGPASRCKTLWPKILNLCEDAGLHSTDELGSPPNLLSVRLTPKSRLGYLSWGYLLEYFQVILDNEGNSRGSNEVWQLLALSERLEADAFQPFVPDELISSSDRRIAQLHSFIDTLVQKLNEAGFIDLEGYRATPGPGYYKRYFTFQGRPNWFIEFNEHKSQRLGISLLLFGGPNIDDRAIYSPPSDSIITEVIINGSDEILIPLDIPTGEEEDVVIQSLFDQVASMARIIEQET